MIMTSTKADKINEDSRKRTNEIIAYAALGGAAKLLKGELTTYFTKDSYGNAAIKIEIIVPEIN